MKLVSDQPTPLEKLLLDASRSEAPSEEHKARMRALLGIGMPLSAPLATPSPAMVDGAPQAVSSKTPLLVMAGVGAGVLALVGAFMLTRGDDSSAVSKAPATAVTQSVPDVTPSPVPPSVAVAPPPQAAPLPAASALSLATPPRTGRSEASSGSTADLSEQIRLIEAARAGLSARNVKATNAALDAYAAQFPRGSFGQEALVLRIRALDQAGDAAGATAMAKSFIARFPKSPHVARLKPIAERGATR
jgi:hypothetical protein